MILRQVEQKIALVTGEVTAPPNRVASRFILYDGGVMTGGHPPVTESFGSLDQLVELQFLITKRARDWRAGLQVFGNKIIDDFLLKLFWMLKGVSLLVPIFIC